MHDFLITSFTDVMRIGKCVFEFEVKFPVISTYLMIFFYFAVLNSLS